MVFALHLLEQPQGLVVIGSALQLVVEFAFCFVGTSVAVNAEKLVESAPHIRSEQDLLEGMQYLAGGILATVHAAWATEKTHPFFIQGTGPFTKMGLDNPDTLYWGARINDDAEYIVTGTRGTTADLSFQVLSGNYTNANVPGSEITHNRGGIHNSVTRVVVKPTHMIGGYAQLSWGFNYYGTVGSNRDEFVILRKVRDLDWRDRPLVEKRPLMAEELRE